MSVRTLLRKAWLILGVLQIVAVLCALEQPARAYVDPGSGYVFLQVIGSMFAGALFYLRHRLRRIFGVVAGPSPAENDPAVQQDVQQ
jgi:hypothetical protein